MWSLAIAVEGGVEEREWTILAGVAKRDGRSSLVFPEEEEFTRRPARRHLSARTDLSKFCNTGLVIEKKKTRQGVDRQGSFS